MEEGKANAVEAKECPMCGEFMRLVTRQHSEHVPGLPAPIKHVVKEWICPECDYFEEVED
jgi:C4-type Zn-finger protein